MPPKPRTSLLAFSLAGTLVASVQAQTSPGPARDLEAVTVTGSNIKTTDREGANPVQVIDAKEIAASGKSTLPDFLRSLSANTGKSFNEQAIAGWAMGTASIALRGLSVKNTLVLIDGHRVSTFATVANLQDPFVDLNAIPASAVARIEVLKDGASAVYGSDAVAGVVNIILKHDVQGFEAGASYGAATQGGTNEKKFHLSGGWGDFKRDGYNLFATVEGYQRGRLDFDERDYVRGEDFRNQPGGRLQWGQTARYLTNPQVSLSPCPPGTVSRPYADFNSTQPGNACAYDTTRFNTLVPSTERYQAALRGTLRLSDDVSAFGELVFSRSTSSEHYREPPRIGNGVNYWDAASGTLRPVSNLLPVGSRSNPYDRPVPLDYYFFDLGVSNMRDKSKFYSASVGLDGRTAGWDWHLALSQSASSFHEYSTNFYNRYAIERLLADDSYNFLDPASTPGADRDVAISALRPAIAKLRTVDLTATRELFDLPAGSVGFAAGAQFRHESEDSRVSPTVWNGTLARPAIDVINGSRSVSAAYAEFNVPLLSTLEANVAGRLDHYNDFGNAFTPKFSLRWQPLGWLLWRASFSRAFRAPSLAEMSDSTAVSYGSVRDPRDPLNPGGTVSYTNVTRANPDLKPEHAKNYNLGVVVSPTDSTSISLDAYRIKQKDIIAADTAQSVIDNEASLPGRVVRSDIGQLLTIYSQFQNQRKLDTSGVDIGLDHRFAPTAWGAFALRSSWSKLFTYRMPRVAGGPMVQGAGSNVFGALPRWRGTNALDWRRGAWRATLSHIYIGGYAQALVSEQTNPGYRKHVNGQSQFDLSLGWTGLANTDIHLAVQNLFDRTPPFDPATGAVPFDRSQYNPFGRLITLGADYRF